MNVKVTSYVTIDDPDDDKLNKIADVIADALVDAGHGIQDGDPDSVVQTLVTVGPLDEFSSDEEWFTEVVRDAVIIVFPANSEQAAERIIRSLGREGEDGEAEAGDSPAEGVKEQDERRSPVHQGS